MKIIKTASALFIALTVAAPAVHAALSDEIQVYTDEINAKGEHGFELHAITFPSGRSVPDYPGEVVTDKSLFLTLEPSLSISDTVELGLYLPVARDGLSHDWGLAGLKGRIKWLPLHPAAGSVGWYAGANLEVGHVSERYNQVQNNAELRMMYGWRDKDWLIGINPILGWELSDNGSSGTGYGFSIKGTHKIAEGLDMGLEYYSDRGEIGHTLPWDQQDNKLFFVLDVDMHPWVFNFGIGKGLSDGAENTTVKFIFELPF